MIDPDAYAARHLWRPSVGAQSHALYVSSVVSSPDRGTNGGLQAVTICGAWVGHVGECVPRGHVFRAPRGEATCRKCQRAILRENEME